MFCSNCGKEASGKFCANCGAPLEDTESIVKVELPKPLEKAESEDVMYNHNGILINLTAIGDQCGAFHMTKAINILMEQTGLKRKEANNLMYNVYKKTPPNRAKEKSYKEKMAYHKSKMEDIRQDLKQAKEIKENSSAISVSSKSKSTALLFCIFLGIFGVHKFYVGKLGIGILYFFTYGLLGIGWIVDIVLIAKGEFKDSTGAYLRTSVKTKNTQSNLIPNQPLQQIGTIIKSQPATIKIAEPVFENRIVSSNTKGIENYICYNYDLKLKAKRKEFVNYICVDLETTGLSPSECEIIELSAIKYQNNIIVEKFTTLIKPKCSIPSFITKINGINNDMVENSPSIEDVFPKFIDFIESYVLVAHNASFDMKFLSVSACKMQLDFSPYKVDTLSLARKAFKESPNHKLITLIDFLNIESNESHRAEADAMACGCVLQKCLEKLNEVKPRVVVVTSE